MKRKLVLLFAVLIGAAVAFIVNRADNEVQADGFIRRGACVGDDSRICFIEKIGGLERQYYGMWEEYK